MAFSSIATVANQAASARLGVNNISLTEWETTSLPSVAAGSTLQISNTMYQFGADETCDTGNVISAGSVSTLYFLYANPTLLTCQGSATHPLWDDALQGWYQTLSGVYCRCYGFLYKTATSQYITKHVLKNRNYDYMVGMISGFPFANVPGWLRCNGATINLTTHPQYAHLILMLKAEAGADATHPFYSANASEAKLPDYDGRVMRGIDNVSAARDQDGVRKAGSYQADGNKAHTHRIKADPGSGSAYDDIETGTDVPGSWSSAKVESSGNTEATVKNVAAYIMIKY